MQRLAILSDIHGNLPALEAVLADIERLHVDLIVLNGDIADGPFPGETLEHLMRLERPALWLRGNSDRWLVDAFDGRFHHPDPMTNAITAWSARQITRPQRDHLATLPLLHRLDLQGLGPVGFCHATGRSDNEMFLVESSLDHAASAFTALDASTIVVGHSHMPFDRLFDRRRIVNGGSVGMPYGHAGASWIHIDAAITLRRTTYDYEDASARIRASGMPGAEAFAATCVRSTESDADALPVFRAIMRRQQATGAFDDPA